MHDGGVCLEKLEEMETVQPIESKRIRTSLNLQKIHVDGLAKIAKYQNRTLLQ